MNEETARIICEAMTPEQRDALVASAQETARAFRELEESISVALIDMFGAFAQIFSDSWQPIIDELIDELDGLDFASQHRKKWKPVKNTVQRYNCVQRKITPHARSCC